MNTILQFLLRPKEGPRSVLLVRIAVGLIFFTQGILKYIDPNMGVCQGRNKSRPQRRSKSRPEELVEDWGLSGRRASGAEACAA